jgi:sugar phosphate isomerase/epimerase
MGSNCHDHDQAEIPGYWHSLDKGTGNKYTSGKFTAGKLSISTPPMKNQLDSIRARIMQGATNVELGFTGTGKGGAQNLTPGTLGIPERTAIKEIAKINDVGIKSVHTAMSVQGLAGFSENRFNEQKRSQDIEEVKRTIDFASDVTDGGAIVVHTGEFPYSVEKEYGEKPFITKKGKKIKLKEHPGRSGTFPILFVDKYDGSISSAIRPDFRTPIITEDNKIKQVDISYFEKQAEDNLKNRKTDDINRYRRYKGEDPTDEEYNQTFGNKAWLANYHQTNLKIIEERARKEEYDRSIKDSNEKIETIKNHIKITEEILNAQAPGSKSIESFSKRDLTKRKEELEKVEERLEIEKKHAQAYDLRIQNQMKQAFDSIPIEEYGKKMTSQSIAELAMHAKKMTKDKKLKNPLFVAPENLWDGNYGAHPEDLRKIIKDARSEFVKQATDKDNKKRISENEAKRAAKDHIKATFDIGHANIWRKYFGGDENEFKQWLGSEVNKLTKEGIIGHVHVSDNFGYNDEHLPPGYGNAPIKEFMTHLEKGKYKGEVIIEPGHHDIQAYTAGMQHLETPIYRLHNRTTTWADVQGSYFGQTYIPSFVTPTYLPNVDNKQSFTWSELPLE